MQPAGPAHLCRGCRLRRVVLLGCCRAGCPPVSSRSAPGRCSSAAASSARAGSAASRARAASWPALPARDSAWAVRDCASATAWSRSCRAAAACSCAVRASCSAVVCAFRASASRAWACAVAARACRVSASACSARACSPVRASSAAAICASSPARSSAWSRSASRRACASCSCAARRVRSSSARADSAASAPGPRPARPCRPAIRLRLPGTARRPPPGPAPVGPRRPALARSAPPARRWFAPFAPRPPAPGPAPSRHARPASGLRPARRGPVVRPGFLGCRDLRLGPARSSAWSRSASRRACVTCSCAARRARSSSARADSAPGTARRPPPGPALAAPRPLALARSAPPARRWFAPPASRLRPARRGPVVRSGPLRLLRSAPRARPQLGLVPLGIPAGLRQLLLRGPARPVQLGSGRLGRVPRPGRVLPGLAGPRFGFGCPGLRVGHRLVPLLSGRGGLLLRGLRLLLGGGLRLPRLGLPRLGLRRRGTRVPRLGLGPLAAPPEREPLPTRIPWVSRPAAVLGHHLAPPQPCQRPMRLLGHRVRQPAEPPLGRPAFPGRGAFTQPGQAHLRTSSSALTIGRPRSATRTA